MNLFLQKTYSLRYICRMIYRRIGLLLIVCLLIISQNANAQNVRLVSPKQNQYVDSIVEFSWSAADSAMLYTVNISKDTSNTSLYSNYTTLNNRISLKVDTGSFFWRVNVITKTNYSFSTNWSGYTHYLPNRVDSLNLWLIADTSHLTLVRDSFVAQWFDLSSELNHTNYQANAGVQPLVKYNKLNNFSAVRFDSPITNFCRLDLTNSLTSEDYSVFMVYNHFDSQFRRRILMSLNNSNWYMGINANQFTVFDSLSLQGKTVLDKQFVVHNIYSNNDTVSNIVNGIEYGKRKSINSPGTNLRLGFDQPFSDILEIIMINGSITPHVRQNIDQYLMDKYAPPVNLGPDRKVCSFPDSIALGIDYALDYQWSTGDTTDAVQIDSAGKYYVTITDMFERTSVDSVYLTLDTSDYQFSFNFQDTTICVGDTIVLQTQKLDRFAYQWNTSATSTTIEVADAGQYILSVQNCLNNISSDTIQVNLNQPRFSLGRDTIACFNEVLTLQPDSTFNNVSYFWSNNQNSASIAADTSGLYSLRVEDRYGCEFSDSIFVEIDSSLFGLTLGADTSLCAGNQIGLQLPADTISSYLWNTNDTSALLEVNTSGNYYLRVSNGRCQLSDTIQVAIQGQAPTASFSASNFCFMDTVSFSDFSSAPMGDTLVDWKWSFGNQDSAFVPNPMHRFSNVQTYRVLLQVETDKGCIDTAQQNIVIRPKPIADFASFAACAKEVVYFADSSNISSGNIIGYLWNFGDTAAAVNSSNQPNPRHTYDTLGLYQVQLIVESEFGCKDTAFQQKNINPTPNVKYSFKGNCLNDSVLFNNQSVIAGNEQASDFLWIIEGLFYREANPALQFLSSGKKEVFFRVTTDSSCYAVVEDSIEIFDNPIADLVMNEYCEETPFTIQDNSSGAYPITNWLYVIDEDTSYQQNPTFTIEENGTYSLFMKVSDTNECVDSIQRNIDINPKPTADFAFLINNSGAPYRLAVENNSKDAQTYFWDLGNGETSTLEVPDYTYTNPGNYSIKLVASASNTCKDSLSKNLRVLPNYLDAFIENLILLKDVNGYLKVQLSLVNAGNNLIDSIQLEANINGDFTVSEKVDGPIERSKTKGHEMNASIRSDEEVDFVCLKIAMVNGRLDDVLENNELCEAGFNNELMINVFPNPTSGQINFEYVIPSSAKVQIQIFDQLGKKMVDKDLGVQTKGYYLSTFSLSHLKTGSYHYRLVYGDQEKTGTIIKQ
ncbi:MAG: hypothetical protein CMC96_14580 [Flavobacteriales bacterium]|nr:hypothetical protein [Flavobacteriales bacterium]